MSSKISETNPQEICTMADWTKEDLFHLVQERLLPAHWERHMPVSYGLLRQIVDVCKEAGKPLTSTLPHVLIQLKPNANMSSFPSISNINTQLKRKKYMAHPETTVQWLEVTDPSIIGPYSSADGITTASLSSQTERPQREISVGVLLELRQHMITTGQTWGNFSTWLMNLGVTSHPILEQNLRHNVTSVFEQKSKLSKQQKTVQLQEFLHSNFVSTAPLTSENRKTSTITVKENARLRSQNTELKEKLKAERQLNKHTLKDLETLKQELDGVLREMYIESKKHHEAKTEMYRLSEENKCLRQENTTLHKEMVHWKPANVDKRERRWQAKLKAVETNYNDIFTQNMELHNQVEVVQSSNTKMHTNLAKVKKRLNYVEQKAEKLGLSVASLQLDKEEWKRELKESKLHIHDLEGEIQELQKDKLLRPIFVDAKYTDELRSTCMELHSLGLGVRRIPQCIRKVAQRLFGIQMTHLPSESSIRQFLLEANIVGKIQVGKETLQHSNNTLHADGTTDHQHHYLGFQISFPEKTLSMGMVETLAGDTETHVKELQEILQDYARFIAPENKRELVFNELFLTVKNLMTDQHIVNKKFKTELEEIRQQILCQSGEKWLSLTTEERQKVVKINQWFCLLHLLLGIVDGLEMALKEYEAIITNHGAVPLGRLRSGHGKLDSSVTAEAIKAATSLCTTKGHPAAGLPEDFRSFLSSKNKKNSFENFKHNRFNILCHNALALILHRKDLLELLQLTTQENRLIDVVRADLEDNILMSIIFSLALFYKTIAAPLQWLILTKHQAPHIIDMNACLSQILSSLEKLSKYPSEILSSSLVISPYFPTTDTNLLDIAAEFDTEVSLESLSLLCTASPVTFHRQVKYHLQVADSDELRSESESVPKSNIIGESQFALLKHLKSTKPNASIQHLETTILWAYNKTGAWLDQLSETERCHYFSLARELAPEFQNRWKLKRKELSKARLQHILAKHEKQQAKSQKQAVTVQNSIDTILENGGQFQCSSDVDKLLNRELPAKGKISLLKDQLMFYKNVIKPESVERSYYFVSRRGKPLSINQLANNLKYVINQHRISLCKASPENINIPTKVGRDHQIEERRKAFLADYNPAPDAVPSTSRGIKRKASMPDLCGKRINHRWKLNKTHKWFTGYVLGLSDPSSTPSFSDDETSLKMSSHALYAVQYDGDETVYNLCLEKDWYRGDVHLDD